MKLSKRDTKQLNNIIANTMRIDVIAYENITNIGWDPFRVRLIKISLLNTYSQYTYQCIRCGHEVTFASSKVDKIKMRPHDNDVCEYMRNFYGKEE